MGVIVVVVSVVVVPVVMSRVVVVVVVAVEVLVQALPGGGVERRLGGPLPIQPLLRLAGRADTDEPAEAEAPACRRTARGALDGVGDRRRGEDLVCRGASIAAIVDEWHSGHDRTRRERGT